MGLFDKLFGKKEKEKEVVNRIHGCNHGECVFCGYYLCFNCDESVPCKHKEKYPLEQRHESKLLDFYKDLVNYYNADYNTGESCGIKAIETYIKIFKPELLFLAKDIFDYAKWGSMENNDAMYFVKTMKDVNLQKKDIESKINYIFENFTDEKLDITLSWIYNSSLYDRNYEEFKYTVNALNSLLDESWTTSHFINTNVIDLNMLFDNKGNIKPAGLNGEEGDTIFNVIESWAKDNEY